MVLMFENIIPVFFSTLTFSHQLFCVFTEKSGKKTFAHRTTIGNVPGPPPRLHLGPASIPEKARPMQTPTVPISDVAVHSMTIAFFQKEKQGATEFRKNSQFISLQ